MSTKFSRSGFHYAVHVNPDRLEFSLFTSEEIKKLAVKKIITPVTFDALGHPLDGGLYDKAFGPITESGDPCGTCNNTLHFCPGHYGYIEIPLLVVNPLFHRIISVILKHSCFSCFHLQIPAHIKHTLSLQMKLLDVGFLSEAIEIEYRISELISKYELFENIPEEALGGIKHYEQLIKDASGCEYIANKNSQELKNKLIYGIATKLKPHSYCMHCKAPLPIVHILKNKITISTRIHGKSKEEKVLAAKGPKFLTPEDSRKMMRKIWENEKDLILELVPVLKTINAEIPIDVLYMDVIAVPPSNIRPINVIGGMISEHRQTHLFKTLLQNSILLRSVIHVVKNGGNASVLPPEASFVYNMSKGNTALEKMNFLWENVQENVDNILDCKAPPDQGLKQIIEKKFGIIRMHMMGKRVNYAARSVITPDPNLNIDEIGIPEEFAKKLSYPVPVTAWNVEELRKLIMNGPDVHPGAVMVEFEDGRLVRIQNKKEAKETLLKRLLTPDDPNKTYRGVKLVYRHLMNGDVMLLNRQPTLHKPSIMAHTARVLKGEKTLRLHYANCKAYNADFDGDEMNAHFPQSEVARSEGYTIVNVSNQYLVPKDGTPLSGLIQDHMIAGVRLSLRGKFFNKQDYQQLVFQALSFKHSHLKLLPPAIIKPYRLWSGKQVISTVLLNIIPKNKSPINLTASSKIPAKTWITEKPRKWKAGGKRFKDDTMSEAEVIIRKGELLVGILDKTHYGATPYGLVHCMYELYGGTYAIRLLSSLAKLFTYFLQREGFTLGVHDILVLSEADKIRQKVITESRQIGETIMQQALNLKSETTKLEDICDKLEEQRAINPKIHAIIDRQYKSSLDSYTNTINTTCLPAGLISKFPENNLQLMVLSGAKGSTVNTMQISCLLGQIELEGKRPPVMISGKSLPSFPSHEFTPRAGGFIDGRFMTGIQPQEFFFHCMAGREGLIDTAVKTSRSGYLQRCLIKHLEGLTVGYDMTVRDSDKSIVQFAYGEDGMDITKAQFLNSKQLKFLADNRDSIIDDSIVNELKNIEDYDLMLEHKAKLLKNRKSNNKTKQPFTAFSSKAEKKAKDVSKAEVISARTGRSRKTKFICEMWQDCGEDIRKKYFKKCRRIPEPIVSKFQPDHYYGSINDRLLGLLQEHKEKYGEKDAETVEKMLQLKSMQSLCAPGEPVGLLAAQSIGEPSTQMTLNTFHFAGRGEMNVTLGIPRLREILMLASKTIKTPSMEVPFLEVPDLEKQAAKLRKLMCQVTVADVLEKIDVSQEIILHPHRVNKIVLRFQFMPKKLYKNDYCVRPKQIINYMGETFFKLMFRTLRKYAKVNTNNVSVEDIVTNKRRRTNNEDDDDEDDAGEGMNIGDVSSDDEDEPEDVEDAKETNKFQQLNEDDSPEDVEIESEDDENLEESFQNKGNEKSKRKPQREDKDKSRNEIEEEDEIESEDDENESKDDENLEESFQNEGNKKSKRKSQGKDKDKSRDEINEIDAEDLGDLSLKDYQDICKDVINKYQYASNYRIDGKKYSWCELTVNLSLVYKNIDISAILREVAAKAIIWETPGIKRAITYTNNNQLMLRTDGINLIEMFKYHDLLDLNKLYSNDIHQISHTYGIEAAVKVIVKEVKDVFKVYGITVDPRHLSLIADYMTSSGTFKPLSRKGMENSASPLQQMSFESSLTFLKSATLMGKIDELQNPSSCLMLGKPCYTGTGSFSLLERV